MVHPEQPNILEDEDFVYVPEELFKYLPDNFQSLVNARKKQGETMLDVADKDLHALAKLVNAFPSVISLGYTYQRLRDTKFRKDMDSVLEQEMLTTAFIVTYGRLFTTGHGTRRLSRDIIPSDLREIHDAIMQLRHQRYAHNDEHETVKNGITIDFDNDGFHVKAQMSIGFHVGGRDEWEHLVSFLNEHMHDQVHIVLGRLRKKTGYEWSFSDGPKSAWSGE